MNECIDNGSRVNEILKSSKNKIKMLLTTFDYNKERLMLYSICNVIALDFINKDCDLENISNFGVSLGYALREITVLRSSPESIAEILISLYEANKNYINNFNLSNYTEIKNPFGVNDVIPSDILELLPMHQTQISDLVSELKVALRS